MRRRQAMLLAWIIGAGLAAAIGARQPADAIGPPAQLTARPWLNEIVRHLYRWYIDERDVDGVVMADEVIFWVRELKPNLDEGDHSRFGEIVLPQFAISVIAKQAVYTIPELNATVRNDSFRVVHVGRIDVPEAMPEGAIEIRADYTDLRDELFRTRNLAAFPEGELLERLRAAVRAEIRKDLQRGQEPFPLEKQLVYLAPLSPIANETWVFWETGRTLIRFASDIDLTNPAVWEHESLAVKLFPLDEKVVVSLDEIAGSNAFMTRDQAGRTLFNCIVLGRRVELQPPEPDEGAPGEAR